MGQQQALLRQQQQQTSPSTQSSTPPLNGLASNMRPQYFKSSPTLSALLSGKAAANAYPSPPLLRLLARSPNLHPSHPHPLHNHNLLPQNSRLCSHRLRHKRSSASLVQRSGMPSRVLPHHRRHHLSRRTGMQTRSGRFSRAKPSFVSSTSSPLNHNRRSLLLHLLPRPVSVLQLRYRRRCRRRLWLRKRPARAASPFWRRASETCISKQVERIRCVYRRHCHFFAVAARCLDCLFVLSLPCGRGIRFCACWLCKEKGKTTKSK